MNFFSEKYNLPEDEGRRVDGAEGASTSPKLKTDLTDNIFAYDTFIYPKKSKSEPYELRVKEVNPKGGQL